jgi:hypothetical protein
MMKRTKKYKCATSYRLSVDVDAQYEDCLMKPDTLDPSKQNMGYNNTKDSYSYRRNNTFLTELKIDQMLKTQQNGHFCQF